MNLYKITFNHSAGGSDNIEGIEDYYFANNDEEIYEFISKHFSSWNDVDDEGDDFKARIIANRGEVREDFGDPYYGITSWSWELVAENMGDSLKQRLIILEIAKDINEKV